MKIFGLILLFLPVFCWSNVLLKYQDGWSAVLRLENMKALPKPVVFIIYNQSITNSALLIDDSQEHTVPLSLPEGECGYIVKDGNKKIIEQGKLSLKLPVDVKIKSVEPKKVVFSLASAQDVFVECCLTTNHIIAFYQRIELAKQGEAVFSGLPSGTEFTAEFKVKDVAFSKSFTTPLFNAALNKPISGTFNRLPESKFVDDSTPAITRVNDGLVEWYKGMAVSTEVGMENQYVIINLLGTHHLKSMKVIWNANYYPLSYYIMYSMDGVKWEYFERKDTGYKSSAAPDNSPIMADEFPVSFDAVFIGVWIDKNTSIHALQDYKNYVQLMEMEAYE